MTRPRCLPGADLILLGDLLTPVVLLAHTALSAPVRYIDKLLVAEEVIEKKEKEGLL